MALSLRARVEGLTAGDIEASRVRRRSLVRTWCMRGTLHLLAARDLEWLLSAINPGVVRGGWRWLDKRAGLKTARARQVLEAAYQILKANGPLPRRELMAAVSEKLGFDTAAAAAGVVQLNGVLGRVCFGPQHGNEPTYAALDDWLGRPLTPGPGVAGRPDHAKLPRRYLHGYGPATPRDLAAWWGLALGEAKAAWAALRDELIELEVDGEPAWLLKSDAGALAKLGSPATTVRLLPAFDTYLLGYDRRNFAVPAQHHQRVFHGGEIVPTVMVNGCAAGTWRYEQRGQQMRITVTPFAAFTREVRELVAEEAEDVGRFYGLNAALSYAD